MVQSPCPLIASFSFFCMVAALLLSKSISRLLVCFIKAKVAVISKSLCRWAQPISALWSMPATLRTVSIFPTYEPDNAKPHLSFYKIYFIVWLFLSFCNIFLCRLACFKISCVCACCASCALVRPLMTPKTWRKKTAITTMPLKAW